MKYPLSLLTILIQLLMVVPVSSAKETIKIATGEQAPYTSQNFVHQGFISHLVTAAFETQSIHVEFEFLPWPRTYKDAGDGRYAATSFWYRDRKHLENFYLSDTLIKDRVVFFRKKSALPVTDFQDIKRYGLRMGLTRGYTYNDEIWEWARENTSQVSVVSTDLQNLRMLAIGRIDIFPNDEVSGWYNLIKHFSEEQVKTFETVGQGLMSQEVTILFPKSHPDAQRLIVVFNRGLSQIKTSGLFKEMQLDFVSGKYVEQ